MNNLKLLKEFGEIADKLNDKVMLQAYWDRDEEITLANPKANKELREYMTMSEKKFMQCFTI